jgi:hypothetical protein
MTPPFPEGVFPGWFEDMVGGLSESLQVPVDAAAQFGLGVLAAAVSRKAVLEVRLGWLERLNLYSALSMGSGETKSPVATAMRQPVDDEERRRREAEQDDLAARRARRDVRVSVLDEAKKRAAKAKGADLGAATERVVELEQELARIPVPEPFEFVCDDVTPEALARVLARGNETAALITAEGLGFFQQVSGRYSRGTPNLGLVLGAWGGESFRERRVGRQGVELRSPCLTVAIALQPEALRAALQQEDLLRGGGLLARFLYASPQSALGSRRIRDAPPVAGDSRDLRGGRAAPVRVARDDRGGADRPPCDHSLGRRPRAVPVVPR